MVLSKWAVVKASRNSVLGTTWASDNVRPTHNARPIVYVGVRQSVMVSTLTAVMVSRLAASNLKTMVLSTITEVSCQIMSFRAIFWLPSADSK